MSIVGLTLKPFQFQQQTSNSKKTKILPQIKSSHFKQTFIEYMKTQVENAANILDQWNLKNIKKYRKGYQNDLQILEEFNKKGLVERVLVYLRQILL